jgi:hypothetical protein
VTERPAGLFPPAVWISLGAAVGGGVGSGGGEGAGGLIGGGVGAALGVVFAGFVRRGAGDEPPAGPTVPPGS